MPTAYGVITGEHTDIVKALKKKSFNGVYVKEVRYEKTKNEKDGMEMNVVSLVLNQGKPVKASGQVSNKSGDRDKLIIKAAGKLGGDNLVKELDNVRKGLKTA